MIATGTFLYMTVKMVDNTPIPLILGKTHRGYFICLLDYEVVFELDHKEDLDADCFTQYMDGYSAEFVATTVKQTIELLSYCKDVKNIESTLSGKLYLVLGGIKEDKKNTSF